ncbi:MAG: DUF308 domain-containing protein [Blautia obeum]
MRGEAGWKNRIRILKRRRTKYRLHRKYPQNATPTRSYVLMILAGCYLLYTGYRLCKNVIDGVDGGSWGFFAAGIGFLIVGAVMLFIGGKNFIKRDKEKRAMEEAARAEEKAAEPEKTTEKKTMSIGNVRDWRNLEESERRQNRETDESETADIASEENRGKYSKSVAVFICAFCCVFLFLCEPEGYAG